VKAPPLGDTGLPAYVTDSKGNVMGRWQDALVG